jgi:uncharacterized delta-60 repeat protein
MTSFSSLARVATLFTLVALSACGGGGVSPAPGEPNSGGNSPPPPPPPPADFALTLSTDKALVIQGHTAQLTATVTRHGNFAGDVSVTLKNLPAGVTAAPVVIAQGATSAVVTLSATAAAPHSLPTAATADGASGTQTDSEALTVTVGGAPGVVDTSFNGGKQIVSVAEGEDYARAIAVQADGKIVTVGMTTTTAGGADIAVMRQLRDGTLDTTFGNGGFVVTAIGAARASDEATAVAIQADGKIVVAGHTVTGAGDTDFALVRYNADGALDNTFGTGGKVVTSFGPSTDRVLALVIQADGKIVAGGDSDRGTSTSGQDFALARYNPNGTLDNGFGTAGKVTSAIRPLASRDSIYALQLQQIGGETRIVAVGGEGDFVAARYNTNGTLDNGFGTAGKIAGVWGTSTIGAANAVTLTADNKIVIAGHIQQDFALARLNLDGTLDAGFGSAGKVITPLAAANWDQATAIVRAADGKLLVGGWVYAGPGTKGNFAVLRYASEGTLDATFGNGGKVITPVSGSANDSEMGRTVVLQADERITTVRLLQAGEASSSGFKFGVVRYWL